MALIPSALRRREAAIGIAMTLAFWVAALFLWSASDIAEGSAFPLPYKLVLLGTFALGVAFSVLLAATVAGVRKLPRSARLAATIAAALVLALLHAWIDAYMLSWLREQLGAEPARISRQFFTGLMPFILIYGLYAATLGLVLSAMTMRQREIQLAEARNAAQHAQLAALRLQLNPHFLFNTLNAISSLIVTNRNADAELMTMKLSEFLRTSLESDLEAEVTLDEELATTQSYLDIEAVRFGERLRVDFECPTPLLDAKVPSLLLQPLVENSIKYAVAPAREKVTLSVRISSQGENLQIVVEDDGRRAFGARPSGSTGLGLANVRARLAAFYGAAGSVTALATERGFMVTLVLPLRVAHETEGTR